MKWTCDIAPHEVISLGRKILENAAEEGAEQVEPLNFLEFADEVVQVLKFKDEDYLNQKWVKPFLVGLKTLQDDFEHEVQADPFIIYKPAHAVALAFHKSPALIRYNRSANRTSKTETAYIEHVMVATGRHRWRIFAPPPTATFIVGVDFVKYAPSVFEAKFINGEPGNNISPLFPEGGRWLHKYNDRAREIFIACNECAMKWKPKDCKHLHSIIRLFSDKEGASVLQGAQYNMWHFDEHIDEEFFGESMERIKTVPLSCGIVTGTPLLGKGSWEYKKLEKVFRLGPEKNKAGDRPWVTIHSIDQYSAGLVPKEAIDASRMEMDPMEEEARIWGRAAPLAKHSVFDRRALYEMEQEVSHPTIGYLDGSPMLDQGSVYFKAHPDGELSVWNEPEEGRSYIIGVDVAVGLTNQDYSCASVLRLPDLRLDAQWHGWKNPLEYAVEVARLGKWYNTALLVPERTGVGIGTITKLRELFYWNIFRDLTDPTQVQVTPDAVLGVDTNVKTKSHMVACLQSVIKDRAIEIRCAQTIEELRGFGQELTPTGQNIRLRGENGTHDDRVMSLVFAVYVSLTYPIVMLGNAVEQKPDRDATWTAIDKEIEACQRFEKGLLS